MNKSVSPKHRKKKNNLHRSFSSHELFSTVNSSNTSYSVHFDLGSSVSSITETIPNNITCFRSLLSVNDSPYKQKITCSKCGSFLHVFSKCPLKKSTKKKQ